MLISNHRLRYAKNARGEQYKYVRPNPIEDHNHCAPACCPNMKLFVVVLVTLFGASLQADEVCNSDACKAIAKEYTSYMRPEVSPCEDFYEYACGNFPKVHPITPQEGRLLSFTFRENSVVHEVDAAIHAADSSKSNTVRFLSELYQECNASGKCCGVGQSPEKNNSLN